MKGFLLAISEPDSKAIQNIDSTVMEDIVEKMRSAFPKFIAQYLPRILFVLVLLFVSHFIIGAITKGFRSILRRSKVEPTLHNFIVSAVRITLYVLLIVICLSILNLFSAPLVTIVGSFGLALSLATKDTLSNVAGGISVLFNRPFRKGDLVEVKGVTGVVRRIDLVYTILTADDGKQIYFPNGDISKSVVTNYSVEPLQKLELELHIPIEIDFETAKTTTLAVLAGYTDLLQIPAPILRLQAEKGKQTSLLLSVWCRQEKIESIKPALQEELTKKLTI